MLKRQGLPGGETIEGELRLGKIGRRDEREMEDLGLTQRVSGEGPALPLCCDLLLEREGEKEMRGTRL